MRRQRGRHERLLTWPLIAHSYLFLGLIEAAFSLHPDRALIPIGVYRWNEYQLRYNSDASRTASPSSSVDNTLAMTSGR